MFSYHLQCWSSVYFFSFIRHTVPYWLKSIKIPVWFICSYFRYRKLGFIYNDSIVNELIALRFIKDSLAHSNQ